MIKQLGFEKNRAVFLFLSLFWGRNLEKAVIEWKYSDEKGAFGGLEKD